MRLHGWLIGLCLLLLPHLAAADTSDKTEPPDDRLCLVLPVTADDKPALPPERFVPASSDGSSIGSVMVVRTNQYQGCIDGRPATVRNYGTAFSIGRASDKRVVFITAGHTFWGVPQASAEVSLGDRFYQADLVWVGQKGVVDAAILTTTCHAAVGCLTLAETCTSGRVGLMGYASEREAPEPGGWRTYRGDFDAERATVTGCRAYFGESGGPVYGRNRVVEGMLVSTDLISTVNIVPAPVLVAWTKHVLGQMPSCDGSVAPPPPDDFPPAPPAEDFPPVPGDSAPQPPQPPQVPSGPPPKSCQCQDHSAVIAELQATLLQQQTIIEQQKVLIDKLSADLTGVNKTIDELTLAVDGSDQRLEELRKTPLKVILRREGAPDKLQLYQHLLGEPLIFRFTEKGTTEQTSIEKDPPK